MGVAGLAPYIPWGGRVASGSDLNNLTQGGLWFVNTTTNSPSNETGHWLIDVKVNPSGIIMQSATAYTGTTSKAIYTRVFRPDVSNTWSDWV